MPELLDRDTTLDDAQADRLLAGLLALYSPSTREQEAVAYLVSEMEKLGLRATVDGAGNAVGELGGGPQTILLLGHIDTVPGFIEVRREGSLLYGRGAVDAKGPLAAFVTAAARAGPQPGKRLVVVGAVEEECATSKGARYILDQLAPDAVIIGEPGGWDSIVVGYKGRLLVDYTLLREIGHTAGPDLSTCEQAVAFWQQVSAAAAEWNVGKGRMFEQLTSSLRHIHSRDDGFTETVTMTLGFRLPEDVDVDAWQARLRTLAGEATLHFRGHEVAFRAPRSTRLARTFLQAIQKHGARAVFTVKSGTSDMNVVGPVWKCPILAYGPGDSMLDHTPREHIDLDEYHRTIDILAQVLTDLPPEIQGSG